MRLSEAMMLGEIRWPRNDGSSWFTTDGEELQCGCAIGRAWYAVGRNLDDWLSGSCSFDREWPWIGSDSQGISTRFNRVVDGAITFEQLVDYVRSVEPECGDCNRFDCTCKPAEVQVEEHAHA